MTTATLEPVQRLIADEMRAVDEVIRARLHSEVVLVRQVAEYIVGSGGKQYRVSAGEKLRVESLPAEVGSEITLDQVLMVGEGESVKVGTPILAGASVKATVLSHGRGEKVHIFKMRRRKHYRKSQGHRQNYTEIQISGISA